MEVWRETAIHSSRETPMFLRGSQEGGKSDFVVKVKWQRYLEASVQSIRDLEVEPAADQATLLCCPRLPAGFVRTHLSPQSHYLCLLPLGTQWLGTAEPSQGLAAKTCFTQAHSGRRKSKSFRGVCFYFHPSSCLFLAEIYAALALAED